MASQEVGHSTWFRSCIPIISVKDDRVRYLDTDTGNAMSMPNPVTIPWAVDKFEEKL